MDIPIDSSDPLSAIALIEEQFNENGDGEYDSDDDYHAHSSLDVIIFYMITKPDRFS